MIQYKDGKGRVIWDGTTALHADILAMNAVFEGMAHEAEITFGTNLPNFCRYLWNLRISYPE